MPKHYGYPEIPQFREVVYQVKSHYEYTGKDEASGEPIYDASLPKPTLTFKGTVKIHGSNLSIMLLKDGTIQFQSKEMVLDDHNDIYGFYHTFAPYMEHIRLWLLRSAIHREYKKYFAIYGEWCGQGIQKKCAIHQLSKRLVLFGTKMDDQWIPFRDNYHEIGIYNINDFPSYYITIDFNNPAASLEEINRLTLEVERECPVAKAFGVSGTGEGIVWESEVRRTVHSGEEQVFNYRFKSKGEKHALKDPSDKVVDPLTIEMFKSCGDFVKRNLGENRLAQGISIIEARGAKVVIQDIQEFLRWAVGDLKKECYLEIEANKLDEKVINKEASKVARDYFIKYLNTNL